MTDSGRVESFGCLKLFDVRRLTGITERNRRRWRQAAIFLSEQLAKLGQRPPRLSNRSHRRNPGLADLIMRVRSIAILERHRRKDAVTQIVSARGQIVHSLKHLSWAARHLVSPGRQLGIVGRLLTGG